MAMLAVMVEGGAPAMLSLPQVVRLAAGRLVLQMLLLLVAGALAMRLS
jgi:hypothetical protein